jgi:hypothetical protein
MSGSRLLGTPPVQRVYSVMLVLLTNKYAVVEMTCCHRHPRSTKPRSRRDAAAPDRLSDESENIDSSDDQRNNEYSRGGDSERGDSSEGSVNTPGNVGLLPDTSSSQPRPMNRLVALVMENLAVRAAAANR